MRITSVLLAASIAGCNSDKIADNSKATSNPPQSVEEPAMTNDQPAADDTGSQGQEPSEPTLSIFALATAVDADDMPPFLQDQLDHDGAFITVTEFQELDQATQQEVAAAVEMAIAHYRQKARGRRAGHTPAKRSADDLEAFLDAAQR